MTTGTQSSLVSPHQSEGVTLKKSDQSQKEIETDGKSDKRGGREEEKKKIHGPLHENITIYKKTERTVYP